MTFDICSHRVSCYLRGKDEDLENLNETWEEQIKQFICEGYKSGEFAILDDKEEEDFLCWSIK